MMASQTKVLVIINAKAGNKDSFVQQQIAIQNAFAVYNMESECFSLSDFTLVDLANIDFDHIHAVVAVGGDGTVRSIVEKLSALEVTIGIIPGGTFNHLAKDLNIPLDRAAAIKNIVGNNIKLIDIASVNDRYFVNNSSLGLYVKAVKLRQLTALHLKGLAMLLASITTLKKFPTFSVKYLFESKIIEVITPLVFVGNNQYTLDLAKFTERKKLDSGKLYLYINHCRSRMDFLKMLLLLFLRKRKKYQGLFNIVAVEECTIALQKSTVDVAIDGEVVELKSPLLYKIHPGKLKVIVPRDVI